MYFKKCISEVFDTLDHDVVFVFYISFMTLHDKEREIEILNKLPSAALLRFTCTVYGVKH